MCRGYHRDTNRWRIQVTLCSRRSDITDARCATVRVEAQVPSPHGFPMLRSISVIPRPSPNNDITSLGSGLHIRTDHRGHIVVGRADRIGNFSLHILL